MANVQFYEVIVKFWRQPALELLFQLILFRVAPMALRRYKKPLFLQDGTGTHAKLQYFKYVNKWHAII